MTLLRGDVILRSLPDEHANLGEVHAEPRDDPSLLRVVDAHVPTHGTLEVVDAAFGADRRRPPARREPAQCTRRLLTRILPIRRCIAVGSVLGIGSILGVAQASLESLLRPRRRAVQVPSGGAQFAGDDLRSLAALFLPGRRRLPPGPGRLHVPLGHAWCALEFRAGRRLCVTHVVVLVDGGRSRGFGLFVRVVDGRVLISTVIPVRAFGCHAERGFGGGDGLREPAALLPPRALLLDVLGEVQHLGRRHEPDVLRVVKSHEHRLGAIGQLGRVPHLLLVVVRVQHVRGPPPVALHLGPHLRPGTHGEFTVGIDRGARVVVGAFSGGFGGAVELTGATGARVRVDRAGGEHRHPPLSPRIDSLGPSRPSGSVRGCPGAWDPTVSPRATVASVAC